MVNKGKKLSLDEARALFSGKSRSPAPPSKRKRTASHPRSNSQISQRITQLERKIMEGNLSDEEETRILQEIGRLEKKLH